MEPQDFSLDFRSGVPVYEQLVQQVRASLASGKLKPGDQLPTVRQMASELRVNFNTIARAYRMLDEANLISTQQGRGTYILEEAEEAGKETLKQDELDALHAQVKHFLSTLELQGYSRSEVETSLNEALKTSSAGNLAQEKFDTL